MAYSVQADIEKEIETAKLVQLADDNNDGVADAAVITESIARADGIIDSYLATRYPVPVSPVPALIRTSSVDIALYFLFTRRDQMTDPRRDAYKEAIKRLEAIAEGAATLPGVTGVVAESGGPKGTRTEEDRLFTIGRPTDDEASNTLRDF
jgi:phage gp36-like protein